MASYNKELFNQIKLVIWDLDETFWQGTLDDGDSLIIPDEHRSLIKSLTDLGIVNSVCSKNDRHKAEDVLAQNGLLEYFVFNSIDWTAKGPRIKAMLTDMGLRAVNVLFIDDNHLNLEEVEYTNPGIMMGFPEVIPSLIESVKISDKKKDGNHKRLKQYKLIEEKFREKSNFSSNHEFLLSSNIVVDIEPLSEIDLDRVHELIMRSNQLNYTKLRSSREELSQLWNSSEVETCTVKVKDRFGDYGLVGFYAIKNHMPIHFLFSCRTIGMGIEQYVYHKIGCPKINPVGEVLTDLTNCEYPDWINVSDVKGTSEGRSVVNTDGTNAGILFKGPCDMDMIFNFIEKTSSMKTEMTYVNSETGVSIQSFNHTDHIVQANTLSSSVKESIISELPFSAPGFFDTELYSGKFRYIILSTLHDAHLGVYRRKADGSRVVFGEALYPLTDSKLEKAYIEEKVYTGGCKFTKSLLKDFSSKYVFEGVTPEKRLVENIRYMLRNTDTQVKFILLLGPEYGYEKEDNPAFKSAPSVFKRNNDALRKLAETEKRVKLIGYGDYLDGQDGFYLNTFHYTAAVYYKISQKICEIINEDVNYHLESKSKYSVGLKRLKQIIRGNKIVDKIITTVRK